MLSSSYKNNNNIEESINKAATAWGINCLRYEIKDVKLPERVQEAMQMQVEAERKKRAAILESEGMREASINKAEGEKQSKILVSEANQLEQINKARGEADAITKIAEAKAQSISIVAKALAENVNSIIHIDLKFMKLKLMKNVYSCGFLKKGGESASLLVAQQYIGEFGKLAKENNTVIMPSDVSNVNSMVTQVHFSSLIHLRYVFYLNKQTNAWNRRSRSTRD